MDGIARHVNDRWNTFLKRLSNPGTYEKYSGKATYY